MPTSSPVYPIAQPFNIAPHWVTAWALPVVGGALLSLGYPNELLPGRLGDHPPCWIGWVALLPLMWMLFRWPERAARRGVWLYSAVGFFGILSWMRLFGVVPWVLLSGSLSMTVWLTVRIMQSMALPRWLMPLGIACAWTGIEWARSQSIFGLAWGEIGVSQVDGFPARMASLGSIYLISFMMLLLTGMLMQAWLDRDTPRWFIVIVIGGVLLFLGAGWWQAMRTEARWRQTRQSQVFALVQPCSQRGLSPDALQEPADAAKDMQRVSTLLTLSWRSLQGIDRASLNTPPVVVWNESALPYPPTELPMVHDFNVRMHCYLLAGAPNYKPDSDRNPNNSAFLFNPNGETLGRYDKIHLVPFGEFVPMRQFVQRWYSVRDDDILPGASWRPLHIGVHPVGVGICFESTLPDIARTYANQGAQYLIYITNDAWFHQTSAVRQHYNCSRFRALETGLPIVRVAGTGISGFIAPDGQSIHEIPTYQQGTYSYSLPTGTAGTVYTLFGWAFGPLCLLISLLLCAHGILTSRRRISPVE